MRKAQRRSISFLAIGFVLLNVLPAYAQRMRRNALNVDGVRREYLVFSPRAVNRPLPVVFLFHGGGGNAQSAARRYGWTQLVEREQVLLIVPNGLDGGWNDLGRIHGDARDRNDDVAFIRQLVDQLPRLFRVDRERVYATGHSNGGFFTYSLACALPGVFAAIGPVAGSIGNDRPTPCDNPRPLSVMHVHGAADRLVPFSGGRTPSGSSIPVRTAVGFWARIDRCGDPVQQTSKSVTVHRYQRCSAGNDVVLYVLPESGHEWPTAPKGGFAATDELWRFFKAHRRR